MKANPSQRFARIAAVAATLLLASSCSEQRIIPAPAPAPAPTQPPIPAPTAPATDWRDAAITPGDWQWASEGGHSVARFAGGLVILRCDRAAGSVTLERSGTATRQVPMTISSSALTRPVTGTPVAGPPPQIAVTFAARDPLLDAMAFSRGRFAIEAAGLQTLYVPSWPEVSRVIEDCR